MTKACSICGKQADLEHRFCTFCGTKFPDNVLHKKQIEYNILKDSHMIMSGGGFHHMEIDTNFIKNSEIMIDNSNIKSSAPREHCPKNMEVKIGDSVIIRSPITIDQSTYINGALDIIKNKEQQFKKFVSDIFQSEGIEGIHRLRKQIEKKGEELDLAIGDYARILKDLQELFEQEEKTRKKYRICFKNRIEHEMKTLGEVIKFLNDHKYNNCMVKVDINQDEKWRPVWTVYQIFHNPEVELICSRTADRISKEEAEVCIGCHRIFKKKFLNSDKRCQECAEDYQNNRLDSETEIFNKSLNLDPKIWKWIPAGKFIMGSPESEFGRNDDEKLHPVKISRDFYVYVTPITEKLYSDVMGGGKGRNEFPIVNINWYEAIHFCNSYSKKLNLNPCYEIINEKKKTRIIWKREIRGVRLLTEAEWEYACRAGSQGPYFQGNANNLYKIASYDTTEIEPLGKHESNRFGLHDMLGNIWEWVWDGRSDYPTELTIDPSGQPDNILKVVRGGSFADIAENCRCAKRYYVNAYHKSEIIGFRVCITI